VAPEIVKPVPLIVAALTVTEAVPVEASVNDWVDGEFRVTLPKAMLVALTVSVGVAAPSCRAKVSVVLAALALNVTEAAVLTEETVAVKAALVAPAATVTEAGTVTALLLLERLTANPPVAAAVFSVTVQLSVPAAVMELLVHVRPVSTGVPVPLRLTAVEDPVDELLVRVSEPVAAPAAVGSNCTVNVAV